MEKNIYIYYLGTTCFGTLVILREFRSEYYFKVLNNLKNCPNIISFFENVKDTCKVFRILNTNIYFNCI